MKRHPSLVPLSHDHHHALVEARRLRRAAGSGDEERLAAAAGFLRFFSTETLRHFREEEERLFPILVGPDGAGGELLVQALLEHQRMHALVGRLEDGVAAGEASASQLRELGELLEAHVRLEERQLFPLIQEVVAEETLEALDLARSPESPVVDLLEPRGTGPLWGTATGDLNATLLAWPQGGGPAEHVNDECDFVLVVLAGSATVTVDGEPHAVHGGESLVVEKGRSRSISAGPDGVRYLTVHRRRPPPQIARLGSA
jgi:quercetin dioxygenase-like cupin family protein/hemerythrin-like domain-containing protein